MVVDKAVTPEVVADQKQLFYPDQEAFSLVR